MLINSPFYRIFSRLMLILCSSCVVWCSETPIGGGGGVSKLYGRSSWGNSLIEFTHTHTHTHTQTDRHTDTQTDRQTDRKTDIYIYIRVPVFYKYNLALGINDHSSDP